MADLTLHSRLKGFQLIESLYDVQPAAIGGVSHFKIAPLYLGLEAMAQLAALHVRHCVNFKRHAFLLKVRHYVLPQVDQLTGAITFQAKLLHHSSNAFVYRAEGRVSDQVNLAAELIIGTQEYDNRFKRECLQVHYQRRFERLLLPGNQKL